jgi:hypothetical protein
MMIHERITPRITTLALACFVVAAAISVAKVLSANSSDLSADRDIPQTESTKSPPEYTPSSITIACGVIPYEGYDGWTGSESAEWKCDDGSRIYFVKEEFASPRGAKAERLARLKGKAPAHKPWRIAQTESVGDTTIVELAEPLSFGGEETSKWVMIWGRNASLFLICGPDREHVKDFYQSSHVREAKK